jgi:hypothetical protein
MIMRVPDAARPDAEKARQGVALTGLDDRFGMRQRLRRVIHAASRLFVRRCPGIGALKLMGIGVALINPAS